MTATIQAPYPIILGLNGQGLTGGNAYVGTATQDPATHPQAVYWDAALTIPASQPLSIVGGYLMHAGTPASAYTGGPYSLRITDKNGALVFYEPVVSGGGGQLTVSTIAALRAFNGSTTLPVFVMGYATPGDGGEGLFIYDSGSSAADNGGTVIVDAAGDRWRRMYSGAVNPKWFGAKGDGATNDAAAMQAAVSAVLVSGGKLRIPAGKYLLNSTVLMDLTAHTSATDGKSITIEGDGADTTWLVNGSNSNGLRVLGNSATEACHALVTLRDFGVTKTGVLTSDIGIKVEQQVWMEFDRIHFYGNSKGFVASDIVTSNFQGCVWRNNLYGADFLGVIVGSGSAANAINFYGCSWYGNANHSVYSVGGCNIGFFGGTMETTQGGADANRYGMLIDTPPGVNGVGVLAVHNMYFEGNENIADIWVKTGDYPVTISLVGNTFNRIDNTHVVTNNVLIDTNGNTNVRVDLFTAGNGFRQFGAYVASAARAYIKTTGATPVAFHDPANYYNTDLERPMMASLTPLARARFDSAGNLNRAVNIASVVHTGTGTYTVNFLNSNPNVTSGRIFEATMDILGWIRLTGETASSLSIVCTNASGVATDPGTVGLMVWE